MCSCSDAASTAATAAVDVRIATLSGDASHDVDILPRAVVADRAKPGEEVLSATRLPLPNAAPPCTPDAALRASVGNASADTIAIRDAGDPVNRVADGRCSAGPGGLMADDFSEGEVVPQTSPSVRDKMMSSI